MESYNQFEKHFDLRSFLPILLFIFGIYTIYLVVAEQYGAAMVVMLLSFVVYATNNILINYYGTSTLFNEYLEDMAAFVAFGVSTMIFGFIFFTLDISLLAVILFYSICILLSLARNWVLKLKNSNGWPIALNGLFFPLAYYVYVFYLSEPGRSIFVIFYLVIAVLSLSHNNFLGYEEKNSSKEDESEPKITIDRDTKRI